MLFLLKTQKMHEDLFPIFWKMKALQTILLQGFKEKILTEQIVVKIMDIVSMLNAERKWRKSNEEKRKRISKMCGLWELD